MQSRNIDTLFSRYLNTACAVTQEDYSNLGRLMITVLLIGIVPVLALPVLRRAEVNLHREAPSLPAT